MKSKKRICVTGATGTMGSATLRELAGRSERFDITVLARPSKANRRKLRPYEGLEGFRVVWGDLCNFGDVREAVSDADIVLHIGGMVSPAADYHPDKTLKVNVQAARNIARAVLEGPKAETAKVVYIGSVAQLGDRRPPLHWGRTGDPLNASEGDGYALSKIEAERAIADSGLKHWVSLRQTGILYPALLLKGSDPITFHVPLRGMLEWATVEDSGRLMANICEDSVPEEFWNRFYNIGSGESYRLTNYEFEKLLMGALGCPPPHKSFRAEWFATKSFHGQWYADSDRLEELVPFRANIPAEEYFRQLAKSTPWFFKLAPLAPAPLVRWGMKFVARRKPLGTLYWLENGVENKIRIHFGSREEWEAIPPFREQLAELEAYPEGEPQGRRIPPKQTGIPHGYDETKPLSELTIEDMQQKAESQGGKCLTPTIAAGDISRLLDWECARGHRFRASASLVLLGGHWCPRCQAQRMGYPGYQPFESRE